MAHVEFCPSCGSLNISFKMASSRRGFFMECNECGHLSNMSDSMSPGRAEYMRSLRSGNNLNARIRLAKELNWTGELATMCIWDVDKSYSPDQFESYLDNSQMRHECPTCGSTNVSRGIHVDSHNVVYVCNHCNFREVEFYADSPKEAEQYLRGTLPRISRASHLGGHQAQSDVQSVSQSDAN